jgi:hypothetical protein
MSDPIDLGGIDLVDIRDRLRGLSYFNSVSDIQSAAQLIEGDISFLPPAAFVMVESEGFDKNRYAAGGHAQRGNVTISVLFCTPSQRAADDISDEVEQARRAVRDILRGYKPAGAMVALDAFRYRIRLIGDGLIWSEWLFRTSYDLN